MDKSIKCSLNDFSCKILLLMKRKTRKNRKKIFLRRLDMNFPENLKKGDTIGICAPSGGITNEKSF